MEHPAWTNLCALLEHASPQDIDLRPHELLSSCTLSNPITLNEASKVLDCALYCHQQLKDKINAISSLFHRLTARSYPVEDDAIRLRMVLAYLAIQNDEADLLECLYDPILIRFFDPIIAKTTARLVFDKVNVDVQRVLIPALLEDDADESSLSVWDDSSDSTMSVPLWALEGNLSQQVRAAVAWTLAPDRLFQPDVLNAYGKFAWCAPYIQVLLSMDDTTPCLRGLDLVISLSPVEIPISILDEDELSETFSVTCSSLGSILRFSSRTQSLQARDVFANFVKVLEPVPVRVAVLVSIASDDSHTPPVRGFVIDLIRAEILSKRFTPQQLIQSEEYIRGVKLALDCINNSHELDILSASLNLLRGCALVIDSDARKQLKEKAELQLRHVLLKHAKEIEEEIDRSVNIQLRVPSHDFSVPKSVPQNGPSAAQADYLRTRIVAYQAEELLKIL